MNWINSGRGRVRFAVALVAMLGPGSRAGTPRDAPVAGDDATYRTTVLVRKGPMLGTGTIVGSVEGEALILTAAHVVEGPGPLRVELFPLQPRAGSAPPRRQGFPAGSRPPWPPATSTRTWPSSGSRGS